ncbi:hypothetical protein OPQ81_005452 [Rhizoctonia solani]|nr:hypothetical protein OPQ81_005384 [Rhizoctonia solani]KAJ1304292.1 hypothetical protein OPQ81_005452 [Rhizoctonia solani]
MTGGRWPQGDEFNIIEGINNCNYNLTSLHTTLGCNMAAPPCVMTGVAESNQCDAGLSNNQGFGLRFEQGTFGQRFNAKNGGWYAMRHTKGGISIWFWARDDSAVPEDVRKGIGSVQPENWGLPVADFPSNNCDMKSHFGPHEIVFDLTFCGVGRKQVS